MRNREINKLVWFSIILILVSNLVLGQKKEDFDIEINYSTQKELIVTETSKAFERKYGDSVLVFFESGFDNNYVSVKVDNSTIISKSITTIEDLDFAYFYNIGCVKDITEFRIQIDDAKIIFIEPSMKHKYISINIMGDKVIVDFLNTIPYYD